MSTRASAQFELDKRSPNIEAQPVWGPIGFNYVSAYYLPEVKIYYILQEQKFYIKEGNKWMAYAALPKKYGKLDLYLTYKHVLQDGDQQPYLKHAQHKSAATADKHKSSQVPILDAVKYDDRYKPKVK